MQDPLENAIDRIEILSRISDSKKYLVRTFLSPSNLLAAKEICGWMKDLGMQVSHSADGTVRGILEGSDPKAKPLLLGSHIDTVIDAGKYDGPLGVVSALAALETLKQENVILPFPVHVLAFSDEEGVRFQTTYLGSRTITGPLDSTTLAMRDAAGITIAAAIEDHGWDEGATNIRYAKGQCRGYVELHIEQGRILEEADEACCVVSAIAGQSRLNIKLNGRTDHAGTTPMPMRRDALTGAAECILAAEALARSSPPLVITVGKIQIHPGASNSVPQSATFTVDLRHPEDPARQQALGKLRESFSEIANKRSLRFDWESIQENNAISCDRELTNLLLDSLAATTGSQRVLTSGAGHDGVAVSKICPIAMLFIRCREGLSHHPNEYASPEDIATGISVITHFLKSLKP